MKRCGRGMGEKELEILYSNDQIANLDKRISRPSGVFNSEMLWSFLCKLI